MEVSAPPHITTMLKRNEIFFASVYFVQAAVSVSAIAQFIYTRQQLGLNFIQLGILAALPTISWSIKPIYGFLTDLVPIRGLRRRPYLHIAPLITVVGWLAIWKFGNSFATFAIPLAFANVGLGFTDVLCDALVVDESDKKDAGRYQTICWSALSIGAIIASFLSGFLLTRELVDIRGMFLITASIPLLTFVLSFFVRERPVPAVQEHRARRAVSMPYIFAALAAGAATVAILHPASGIKTETATFAIMGVWALWLILYFRHLVNAHAVHPSIYWVAVFIFLWRFTPSFGAPWQNYLLSTAKVSPELLGYFGVAHYIGWLVAAGIYIKWLDKLPIRKVLFWTIIASVLGLMQLAIARPSIAEVVGIFPAVKYLGAVIALPNFLVSAGSGAVNAVLTLRGIEYLNFAVTFILGILYMIGYLPLLKLAALSTPRGLEGTNFAILMSIMNFGLAFGSASGGYIYQYIQNGIWGMNGLEITIWIGVITSFAALIALPFIKTEHLAHE